MPTILLNVSEGTTNFVSSLTGCLNMLELYLRWQQRSKHGLAEDHDFPMVDVRAPGAGNSVYVPGKHLEADVFTLCPWNVV